MTITVNVGQNPTPIIVGDTVILNVISIRAGVQSASLHNTTAATISVNFFDSPDATSASGVLVAEYPTVPANASITVDEIIGQGYETGRNIIAVAGAVGTNIKITKTVTT